MAGLDYVNGIARPDGDADTLRFGSNQYGVSFWGMRGTEDLGGGVRALFNLEGMITSGTGRAIRCSTAARKWGWPAMAGARCCSGAA